MKYRIFGNLHSISQGDFIAYAEDGWIELPEEIAENMIGSGIIAPPDTEYGSWEQANGRLHDNNSGQTRSRKQRKHR
jgi:hypothetical protein